MIHFDNVAKENIKEHNPNWPQIPDYLYRISVIGGSESGKINSLFNLISQQLDTDEIYLYAKDPYKAKYQFLVNRQEITCSEHLHILKLLLYTQIMWMTFIKLLKNTVQIKNLKYWLFWWYDCWYA